MTSTRVLESWREHARLSSPVAELPPQTATWYTEVIFERADGETDYVYAYTESLINPQDLAPGRLILETTQNNLVN